MAGDQTVLYKAQPRFAFRGGFKLYLLQSSS